MLAELLQYGASFAGTPAGFRRHLGGAVGLWSRGHRQARAWSPHTSKTSGLIEQEIGAIITRRTVVVLGSGPLFDVPLEALARAFERVILVDQAHLAEARRRAILQNNIEFQWRDLSAATHADPLDFLSDIETLDWAISANLISQLAPGAPQDEGRAVIDAHLDTLSRLSCKTTLVTDLNYRLIDKADRLVEQVDLLHGRPMPPSPDHWIWDVAPFGEESRQIRRAHAVAFYGDWTKAAVPGD